MPYGYRSSVISDLGLGSYVDRLYEPSSDVDPDGGDIADIWRKLGLDPQQMRALAERPGGVAEVRAALRAGPGSEDYDQKRYMMLFPQLRTIAFENDPYMLKEFIIRQNFIVDLAGKFLLGFRDILLRYAPRRLLDYYTVAEIMSPDVGLNILNDLIEHYERRFALFDVPLEDFEFLEGSAAKIAAQESLRKMTDLIRSYQLRLEEAEQNVEYLHEVVTENNKLIEEYEERICDLDDQIIALKRGAGVLVEEPGMEDEFINELTDQLERSMVMNSSFREELAAEKRSKQSLYQEICRLQEERIGQEQEMVATIAKITKDIELDENLKRRIVNRIRTLSADPEAIYAGINEWMVEVQKTLDSQEYTIQEIKKDVKRSGDKITSLFTEYRNNGIKIIKLEKQIAEQNAVFEEKLRIYEKKKREVEEINRQIEILDSSLSDDSSQFALTQYDTARSRLPSGLESPLTTPGVSGRTSHFRPDIFGATPKLRRSTPKARRTSSSVKKSMGPRRLRKPISRMLKGKSPKQVTFSFEESPEKLRQGSPYRGATDYFDESGSFSLHSTPPRSPLSPSISQPSPFNVSSPLMASLGEIQPIVEIPGTVAIPGPSSRFAPRIETIDPSTECHVNNRFGIGKSFSMHTVCQTSTPYQQVTRVFSYPPESGYSGHMINYPLGVSHSAVLTPTQYETPFISKSRFGYTDPTARELNIPPGLALRSPLQEQGVSPDVETYGTPPAVTPTTTRRHGLFTPTGIFRRRHYNIRRLYEPENYKSPTLPWSPQYLPEDSRSPVSSLSSSPRYSKDMGASPQYIQNRTFDASSPFSGNRTFDATSPHTINRTFDALSPLYVPEGSRSPVSSLSSSPRYTEVMGASPQYIQNRTFDASSPFSGNRTFDATSPKTINRTFDALSPRYVPEDSRSPVSSLSSSPRYGEVMGASPEYIQNRTFDASSPFSGNRTFDATSPRALNRTFDALSPQYLSEDSQSPVSSLSSSPRNGEIMDDSSQYIQNRTYDASYSLSGDRTFDAASPHTINRTFESLSPRDLNRTYDALSPQNLNITYAAAPVNETFETSPDYVMDRNQPSPSGGTFIESQSPVQNRNLSRYQSFDLD